MFANQNQQAFDAEGQVIDHNVEWKGFDDGDKNRILVSEEGVYSFWIEAVSNDTNNSSSLYGALQLYQ